MYPESAWEWSCVDIFAPNFNHSLACIPNYNSKVAKESCHRDWIQMKGTEQTISLASQSMDPWKIDKWHETP